MDASRLSERERDKSRLFLRYDKERLTRKFEEALQEDQELISRPIKRLQVPDSEIDKLKEEVYRRIEDIRHKTSAPKKRIERPST